MSKHLHATLICEALCECRSKAWLRRHAYTLRPAASSWIQDLCSTQLFLVVDFHLVCCQAATPEPHQLGCCGKTLKMFGFGHLDCCALDTAEPLSASHVGIPEGCLQPGLQPRAKAHPHSCWLLHQSLRWKSHDCQRKLSRKEATLISCFTAPRVHPLSICTAADLTPGASQQDARSNHFHATLQPG
jgi:hypothetical protein